MLPVAKLEFNRQLILWLFSVIPGGAAAVISLYEGFGRMYPDSPNYIKWMEFFAGSNPTLLGLLRTLSFRNATVIIAKASCPRSCCFALATDWSAA